MTLAVLVIALAGFALTKSAPAVQNASTVPSVSAAPEAEAPQLTTIGDSYTIGSNMDSGKTARWPSLLTLDGSVRIQNLAVGSVGYGQPGPNGETFVTQSEDIDPESDAVMFFGSRNDISPRLVPAAAATAIGNALKVVPANKVLVVGPAWISAQVPAEIRADRDAIAAAAADAGVRFVDPLEEGWLVGDPELIGSDGVHPTDKGHAFLKEKIKPLVAELLAE
jgi:lysophospholipase L1-like esterase